VIFVTVGTQLAFDRMIEAVDGWAASAGQHEVFAQIGPGAYTPRHIAYEDFISPAACRERMLAADAIVAHAGMGTILSALELGKPLLVMPRLAALGEHRNDHQLATAKRFAEMGRVAVAENAAELARKLDELDALSARERISPHASSELIEALDAFINA
jgi:UDP-N-acetylglucosamine transferase subunit ALG13